MSKSKGWRPFRRNSGKLHISQPENPASIQISAPLDFQHKLHVGFDPETQQFIGMPLCWNSWLEKSNIRWGNTGSLTPGCSKELGASQESPGPGFNVKTIFFSYRDTDYKDKMVARLSSLCNGVSNIGKMIFLHWDSHCGHVINSLRLGWNIGQLTQIYTLWFSIFTKICSDVYLWVAVIIISLGYGLVSDGTKPFPKRVMTSSYDDITHHYYIYLSLKICNSFDGILEVILQKFISEKWRIN